MKTYNIDMGKFKTKVTKILEDLGLNFDVQINFAEVRLDNGQIIAIRTRYDDYRVEWYNNEDQYKRNVKRNLFVTKNFYEIPYIVKNLILGDISKLEA